MSPEEKHEILHNDSSNAHQCLLIEEKHEILHNDSSNAHECLLIEEKHEILHDTNLEHLFPTPYCISTTRGPSVNI
jgi:hypothetical protein